VSARVAEAYSALRGIKDPHERESALKSSRIWEQAMDMSNYKADEYISRAKKEFDEIMSKRRYDLSKADIRNWLDLKHKIAENMEDLLRKIDNRVKYYLVIKKQDKDQARSYVPSKMMRRSIEAASMDLEQFMHKWEGIINRSGEKLKRKLAKVITAED
jgi:hypothetical protein